jgi:hypothetical protein
VTINYRNNNLTIRPFLIKLIGCALLCLHPYINSYSQSNNNIELSFYKGNDSIKSTDLYFNILKIKNTANQPTTGTLNIICPEGWKLISFISDQITINSHDSTIIPIRISPAANAIGGIAYITTANFRTSSQQVSANTYLSLPKISKWTFSTNKTENYFTETSPSVNIDINLSNKGNTNELIKLDLQTGKLLTFTGEFKKSNSTDFIDLPAFKDTIIRRSINYQDNIKYIDKIKYKNNWKESAVNIKASTEDVQKTAAIQIQKLESNYYNQRLQSSSPLNLDYQLYNLMSNQELRSNLRAYGSLLFSKNREIQYFAGLQNIYFNSLDKIDVDRQLLYNINYTDNTNSITAGYNVSGGALHSINGRGIVGSHIFGKQTKINFALTQNPYNKMYGGVLGYSSSISGIAINTEIVHEMSEDGRYSASSGLFGTSFSLFKYHTFSIQVLGSQAKYKNYNNLNTSNDTTVLGYSYRADYNVRYKKFDLRFSTLNSQHNFIVNSGLQQSYLDSRFIFNNKFIMSLYGNRQYYATTSFPYNFKTPVNHNSIDYLRLTTSINSGRLQYQIGPTYNGSSRVNLNAFSNYNSNYITYQPGLWAAVSIKLNGYGSITPNVTVSNIRFYYKTDDPNGQNYSYNKNIFYNAGINYFDNYWRINAYYSSGSASDLYRSANIDGSPNVSRSIQFRPSYENFFFDRKVKLSAYMNYAYYMPSGRENTTYNLKYDQFFKGGWNLSLSGFMYANTRVDEKLGRISTKDLNFVVSLSKSFNIQQPRQKYYNIRAVFFDDLDGNKIKTNNEPPVTNILVNVQKDLAASSQRSTISEIKLITDINGSVSIENLPKDNYKLSFTPLQNLQSLYFIDGSEQKYHNEKSRTIYIPLAESYKVKGKIVLLRDPNSSEGKIDVGGIRIMATGQKGETYSVLTDNFGSFVISVPKADKYTLHINNVFGQNFSIDNDNVTVQFTQSKTVNLDFTFIENRRSIQFDGGGEFFNFKNDQTQPETIATTDNEKSQEITRAETRENYAIQLASLKNFRDPNYFKNKYKLKEPVLFTDINGVYKYYIGDYTTDKEARAAIKKLGIIATSVAIDRTLLKDITPESLNNISSNQLVPAYKKEKANQSTNNKTNTNSLTESNIQAEVNSDAQSTDSLNQPENTVSKIPGKTTSKNKTMPTKANSIKNNIEAAKLQPEIETKNIINQTAAPLIASKEIAVQPTNKSNSTTIKQNTTLSTDIAAAESKQNLTVQPLSIATKKLSDKKKTGKNIQPELNRSSPETGTEIKRTTASHPDNTYSKPAGKQIINGQVIETANPTVLNNTEMVSKPVKLSKTTQNAKQQTSIPNTQTNTSNKDFIYTIQLDAIDDYHDTQYYKSKYNLPFEVTCVSRDGIKYYYAGKYKTNEEAKADIAKYGISGSIVSAENMTKSTRTNKK